MRIQIESLQKSYPNGHVALQDVTLTINSGLFGLLGPNGAGKTTLMRILVSLIKPTSGEIFINDMNLDKDRGAIRSMTGYLPQGFSTFSKIKAWEFLDYNARLAGFHSKRKRMEMIDQLLHQVGLFEVRERMAGKLSGGMKRRLGIAQAVLGNPAILIVDEPTTGLDPEERIRFRNLLADLASDDRVIILSTHIVGDISSTCNDMALLDNGRIAFHGSPETFIKVAEGHTFRSEVDDITLNHLKEQYPVTVTVPSENGWTIEYVAEQKPDVAAESILPNLEHAYIYFMDGRGSAHVRTDLIK